MVPTDIATYLVLPWRGIHSVDPSTIWDINIEASDLEQLSGLENHVVEDRYGTSKGLLA